MLLSVYLILRNYLSKFFILLIKMNIENIGHFTAGYIFFVQRLLLTDLQLKFLFFFTVKISAKCATKCCLVSLPFFSILIM